MNITGTHFNYYLICHRKLWLFANGIHMEQNSDLVYEGKLIHETAYPQRSGKYEEILLGSIKIDYYDPKNRVVHEIKKSNKKENAHIWQLKYYLYVLTQHGIKNVSGLLEYPKLRKTSNVMLTEQDREFIKASVKKIKTIVQSTKCPECLPISKCKSCSYYDFCYSSETEKQ